MNKQLITIELAIEYRQNDFDNIKETFERVKNKGIFELYSNHATAWLLGNINPKHTEEKASVIFAFGRRKDKLKVIIKYHTEDELPDLLLEGIKRHSVLKFTKVTSLKIKAKYY